MKSVLFIVLALVAGICVAYGYAKVENRKQAVICNQQYALCTSAQCIPDPSDMNRAICFCEVREGKSLGLTSCQERVPYLDKNHIRYVVSTFSLDEFPHKKIMTCPSGKPWANCLDQKCTVDPCDPSRAICMCKIVRTGAFQTLGGNCDPSSCDTGYWSGATVEGRRKNVQTLIKNLGLKQSPERFCQE